MPVTPSEQALKRWMHQDPEARTQAAIGLWVDVSQATVSDWVNGQSRPKHRYALAIQMMTGGRVKSEGWLTNEERAWVDSIKPMRRAAAS